MGCVTPPRVGVKVVVFRLEKPVLTGSGSMPLALSLVPPVAETYPEDPVQASLRGEGLALSDLDPLLPPSVRLLGIAELASTSRERRIGRWCAGRSRC